MEKQSGKRSKTTLPYNWRIQVKALLAKDGHDFSTTQITNLINNRNTDIEKQILVYDAIRKIKSIQKRQQKKLLKFKKVA